MTFTYPAVFTPHKDDKGFHAEFPDLELCEADGPDLEDAIEAARDPQQTHAEDMELAEGAFVRQIMVRIKLLPDND